jgi:hypothetical protein
MPLSIYLYGNIASIVDISIPLLDYKQEYVQSHKFEYDTFVQKSPHLTDDFMNRYLKITICIFFAILLL